MESIEVRVECEGCGAIHVRPEYLDDDRDEPDKIRVAKCPAAHPARDAGFTGCGDEKADLRMVEWRRDSEDDWINPGRAMAGTE